ncbi:uncharacterized protein ASPGLDRAFT_35523 [Aspergillus glaucus CBS 516.65]|uniref:Uncharacterized protein n=1 Tax=Aspergillus glaucus CBS 516.65 TaxID=1160497 RepID=A0A1L9VK16_ASPGL|nr:hypothetical protein ASPGLDRAFT_35523 [Aspergillus glaucus CBS 516.65]OJJ84242.1 hypothetical protein ASPGLDRAFT_35523 [Aspergillus glaucus CBS 516.65]
MSADQLNVNLDKVDSQMGELLTAFESHPQMQPPATHPTLFFLFDFVRTTHRTLKSIDAEKFRTGDREARSQAQEVLSRNQFANMLVSDRTGKLALMTGGDPANPLDFGDEIRGKARALTEV